MRACMHARENGDLGTSKDVCTYVVAGWLSLTWACRAHVLRRCVITKPHVRTVGFQLEYCYISA
jgi:hypothetical protein